MSDQPDMIAGLRRWRAIRRFNSVHEAAQEREARRRVLLWAARSRVLSAEEMGEVEQLGIKLVIEMLPPSYRPNDLARYLEGGSIELGRSECYRREEKERELNDVLLQQFRLRSMESAS